MRKLLIVSMMVVALAMVGFVPGTAVGAMSYDLKDGDNKVLGTFTFDVDVKGALPYNIYNDAKLDAPNPENIANFINTTWERSFTAGDVTKFNFEDGSYQFQDLGNDGKSGSFTFPNGKSYEFVEAKWGTTQYIFYLDGFTSSIKWEGLSQGMSHVSGINQVPIPGAAWLLGSGLVALAALRRRQQKK